MNGGAPLLTLFEKWPANTAGSERLLRQKTRGRETRGQTGRPRHFRVLSSLRDLKPTKTIVTRILATIPTARETPDRARGATVAQLSVKVEALGRRERSGSLQPKSRAKRETSGFESRRVHSPICEEDLSGGDNAEIICPSNPRSRPLYHRSRTEHRPHAGLTRGADGPLGDENISWKFEPSAQSPHLFHGEIPLPGQEH